MHHTPHTHTLMTRPSNSPFRYFIPEDTKEGKNIKHLLVELSLYGALTRRCSGDKLFQLLWAESFYKSMT